MPTHKAKKNFMFLLTIILVIMLIGSIKSIFRVRSSILRIDRAKENVSRLTEDNERLKEQIKYVQTQKFIEKEALEKLNLTKPGQKIIIMEGAGTKPFEIDKGSMTPLITKPNWRLWAEKFKLYR